MRKLLVLIVIALVLGVGKTSTAHAKSVANACPGVAKGIYFYRDKTRAYEKMLGRKPTRSAFNASQVRSCAYAKWVAREWRHRARKVHRIYDNRYARFEWANRSISNAITFAGPIFGVSTDRLHNRVSSEGGHGGWVPNRQGSGAGGWFQFMSGTYYAFSGEAFDKSGVPRIYNSWYSPLGQALTAALMFSKGLECTHVGWAASC